MDPGPYSPTAIEPRWTTSECRRCRGAGDVTTVRCPHCGLAIDEDSQLGAWDYCMCSNLANGTVSDTVEELAWYAERHHLEGGYRREAASPRVQVRTLEAIARELKLVNVPVALEVRAGVLERVAGLEATSMLGEVVA
jgi:hypothetical protein